MTEHTFEVTAVQRLGDQIGYGNLMWLASALWRRKLISDWGIGHERGAFLPTIDCLLNEEGVDIAQKQIGFYDEIVRDVLDGDDCCMTATTSTGAYIFGKEKSDVGQQPKADARRIAEAIERTQKYIRKD